MNNREHVLRIVKQGAKKGGVSVKEIALDCGISQKKAKAALQYLKGSGIALYLAGGRWFTDPPIGETFKTALVSDKNGWHRFAGVGDTHLGSKLERLRELQNFYDLVERNDIKTVLHSGNYIDGEGAYNRYELKVHGMDAQLEYMMENYPRKKGIKTYMVSGDDHEGWYAKREGIDIGFYMEKVMERGGRHDLRNLGYMESFVPLRHVKTGKEAMLHIVHPGGGSAYAISYTMQKQIEAYEGGEKPAIVLAGHYHKAEFLPCRNVFGFQTGCFQDQTTFMRKKKLVAVIGGWIIFARQNPQTGAIEEIVQYFKQYFNRGYYVNNRWSLSGDVNLVPRIQL